MQQIVMNEINSSTSVVVISPEEVPAYIYRCAERVEILLKCIDMYRGWSSEVSSLKAQSICHVKNASKNICVMNNYIRDILPLVESHQATSKKLLFVKQRILYIVNNLPKRFNKISVDSSRNTESHILPPSLVLGHGVAPKPPLSQQQTSIVPSVAYLTRDEFDNIPKYLKGRISYEKINSFIDLYNSILKKKYNIVRQKKNSLKKIDQDHWTVFKQQEVKETQGLLFCVPEDFKSLGGVALDKISQNIMSILRHCGRVREVRTSKIVRYVAMF